MQCTLKVTQANEDIICAHALKAINTIVSKGLNTAVCLCQVVSLTWYNQCLWRLSSVILYCAVVWATFLFGKRAKSECTTFSQSRNWISWLKHKTSIQLSEVIDFADGVKTLAEDLTIKVWTYNYDDQFFMCSPISKLHPWPQSWKWSSYQR